MKLLERLSLIMLSYSLNIPSSECKASEKQYLFFALGDFEKLLLPFAQTSFLKYISRYQYLSANIFALIFHQLLL